ncbi:hypothetical protein [Thalassobaculum sp.]|uniref:hypothetical protein n=1 Tax=Thalassobaculum sp. TaxID=2022740 RepID=UPI0032EBA81C
MTDAPHTPDRAAEDRAPAAHTVRSNIGAAGAEEHGAPAPTRRIGTKLLLVVLLLGAVIGLATMFGP